jgi:hypothetical protein
MIVQHPNGNSYIFVSNRVFVSSYSEDIKSLITIELDLSLPLTEWERYQMSDQPKHECETPYCYSGAVVPFGEVICASCNEHYKEMYHDHLNEADAWDGDESDNFLQ